MVQKKRAVKKNIKVDFEGPAIKEDEIIVPSGEHAASEDGGQMMYQSPSGTEILIAFKAMDKEIKELGTWKNTLKGFMPSTEDDYDEEEDDIDNNGQPYKKKKQVGIKTEIFFQYVKSKLSEHEMSNLSERLTKVVAGMKSAELTGQTGLYEELALQVSSMVREQEIAALGHNMWIPVNIIRHFVDKIEERIVKFKLLAKFPRIIPADKASIISKVRATGIFDDFYILYVDLQNEEFETNEEKIRLKDPIVFGYLSTQPNKLYFICDWVDEYCDLTLDSMIEKIKVDDPTFKMNEIGEVDQAAIDKILEEVNKRHLRLKKTNITNYRKLMREEKREAEKREFEARKNSEKSLSGRIKSTLSSWLTSYAN